jgi:acetyl-CoA carboxylase carboxyl transferase subunit beta
MPDWFRRRPATPSPSQPHRPGHAPEAPVSAAIPEGAFTKCVKCGAILYTKDFERDLKVCSKCGHHHRLSADERIAMTVDEGTWEEFGNDFVSVDPLHFPDYDKKLAVANASPDGRNDGLVTGRAAVGGQGCVLAISDFGFARLGGTMGSVFGEKFARAADRALAERLPLVFFCASGGARMHEGLFGLMQMAKTSAAAAQLAREGVPFVVVLTDPTTGGALASIASLGDVIYAEPGATVAFAGDRVAAQAQTQKPPANYKTAEFQMDSGQLDKIVPRKEMALTLARTLAFFGVDGGTPGPPAPIFNIARPADEAAAKRNGEGH